jgi:hypothetical protein
MRTVRLYVLQDSTRHYEDLPYGEHLERVAEIEMQGGKVYHASLVPEPAKTRKSPAGAKLRKRLY